MVAQDSRRVKAAYTTPYVPKDSGPAIAPFTSPSFRHYFMLHTYIINIIIIINFIFSKQFHT